MISLPQEGKSNEELIALFRERWDGSQKAFCAMYCVNQVCAPKFLCSKRLPMSFLIQKPFVGELFAFFEGKALWSSESTSNFALVGRPNPKKRFFTSIGFPCSEVSSVLHSLR